MLTIAQHIGLMQHAVGATPDSRHDLYETFNRAGRYLYNYFPWSWRLKLASLVPVSGDENIPLPSDFEQLESVQIDGSTDRIGLVDLPTIHAARHRDAYAGPGYLMHVAPYTTISTGGAVARFAILYPVPTANGVPDIEIWYRRAWPGYTSANNANNPSIPLEFENALVMLARAYAMHLQDQAAAFEDQKAIEELERLKAVDISRSPTQGFMGGGAHRFMNRNRGIRDIQHIGSITL